MITRPIRFLSALTILTILLGLACHTSAPRLRIATAAHMQYVMPLLSRAFTQETGIECENIFASSGKLTAQIQAGAPYDVFVSADMKYPQLLHQKRRTTIPEIYAYGSLVLWTTDTTKRCSVEQLKQCKHIALANPRTAPYGKAAMETLQALQYLPQLEDRLVFGESIAQTNQFITTGNADMGFTSSAVVLAPHLRQLGQWVAIDTTLYTPMAQGICIVKNRPRVTEAQQFQTFMKGEIAAKILRTFGYQPQ